MKRISLKDIAKLARVSPSTVSLVLNGKARRLRISESLITKITAIAREAGYQPNQVAISLRTGKSKIIGLIVESISGHFFGSLAKIVEDEAERCGYKVIYCSTENDSRKGHELIEMLSQRQVDGYLITPVKGMEKDILNLIAHNKPVVLMDGYLPGLKVPYVLVDNYSGVMDGMTELIRKGYDKIGFITIDLDLIQISQRKKAYLDSLKGSNIPASRKLVLHLAYNCRHEDAIESITSFIQKNKGLQAIFFSTNYLGILGLESIKLLKLSIPDDIAVLCFDDHDLFRLYSPAISVIQQPVNEIASTAVKLLIGQLENQTMQLGTLQVQLAGKYVPRGSI